MKKIAAIFLSLLLLSSIPAFAKSRSSNYHTKKQKTVQTTTAKKSKSKAVSGVKRDKSGRIARSASAKSRFLQKTGYPHGRPGYVVDHIKPLKEGGADDPSNMQWQTVEQAKAKDKWE